MKAGSPAGARSLAAQTPHSTVVRTPVADRRAYKYVCVGGTGGHEKPPKGNPQAPQPACGGDGVRVLLVQDPDAIFACACVNVQVCCWTVQSCAVPGWV
jgi:hypothetical protein